MKEVEAVEAWVELAAEVAQLEAELAVLEARVAAVGLRLERTSRRSPAPRPSRQGASLEDTGAAGAEEAAVEGEVEEAEDR